jgi:hypothetical protein
MTKRVDELPPYWQPTWDELPLKHGEDGREWNDLMAKYSHIGCPGYRYEDNCAEPWDCASKGRCRVAYENMRAHLLKEE